MCMVQFILILPQLKIMFPTFRFALPPKRWFRDNFDKSFLEDRQLGLQGFIDSVLCDRAVCNRYGTFLDFYTVKLLNFWSPKKLL